jgi:chromosome segregation ATPase
MAGTASTMAMPSSTPLAAAQEALAAPVATIEFDAGGASSSNPPPTPKETEVIFGRRLRSGAEPEAALIPLSRVLYCTHQPLQDTGAAILQEWEALEAEHHRLSDWRTQLEERTKAASHQFASERSELERDREDYRKDLQKVFARELEVTRKETRLAKKEVHLDQREEVITELQAKLSAYNKMLEEQRDQQSATVEDLKKVQQGLNDRASSVALAEENLKEKDASLDKRATDLAWREKDLAFREEMLERRDKLLADYELEVEEKEQTIGERVASSRRRRRRRWPQSPRLWRR